MGGGYGRRTIVACDTLAPPLATACLILCGQAQHHFECMIPGTKRMQVQGWIEKERGGGGGGGAMGVITPPLDFVTQTQGFSDSPVILWF